jgi:hypothetical protein
VSVSIDAGGPAFPQYVVRSAGACVEGGMTLRDYFAIRATEQDIQKYLLGPTREQIRVNSDGTKTIYHGPMHRSRAQARYAFADDMLRAREEA